MPLKILCLLSCFQLQYRTPHPALRRWHWDSAHLPAPSPAGILLLSILGSIKERLSGSRRVLGWSPAACWCLYFFYNHTSPTELNSVCIQTLKALQNLLYLKYPMGFCDPSWFFLGPNSWGEAMTGCMISSPITRYQSSKGSLYQVSRSQSFSVHKGEGLPHSAIAV